MFPISDLAFYDDCQFPVRQAVFMLFRPRIKCNWFRRLVLVSGRNLTLARSVLDPLQGRLMKTIRILLPLGFLTAAVAAFTVGCGPHHVAIGVGFGEPVCPYGYYEGPPYDCAPDGYYGPEWFDNGVFLGAGPWYHGRDHFYGRVDHDYDFRHGYHGPFPARGEHRGMNRVPFRGNAMHNPRGHEGPRSRGH